MTANRNANMWTVESARLLISATRNWQTNLELPLMLGLAAALTWLEILHLKCSDIIRGQGGGPAFLRVSGDPCKRARSRPVPVFETLDTLLPATGSARAPLVKSHYSESLIRHVATTLGMKYDRNAARNLCAAAMLALFRRDVAMEWLGVSDPRTAILKPTGMEIDPADAELFLRGPSDRWRYDLSEYYRPELLRPHG